MTTRRPKKEKVKQEEVPSINVNPITQKQKELMSAFYDNDIILCDGPAGVGKTHILVGMAVKFLLEKRVNKVVITRPNVYEGHGLGYLPGDIKEKMAPLLIPVYDELKKFIDIGKLSTMVGTGGHTSNPPIEIIPLEYMRGRTINGIVIVDEAQNATYTQLKNVLTRIGKYGKIVLNGDPKQSDLKKGMMDFVEIMDKIIDVPGVQRVSFNRSDVVRHPIIEKLLERL